MKAKRMLILGLACWVSWPAAAALVELKHFDKELARHGVEATYSDESFGTLIDLIEDEVSNIRKRAAAATESDQREALEQIADVVSAALQHHAAGTSSGDMADRAAAFPVLKSLLYTTRSKVQGKRKGGRLGATFGLLGNLSLKIPYLTPEERATPLTEDQARREAANLQDPRTGKPYAAPAELAGLSSDQIAHLDVGPDNHLWYTEKALAALRERHGTPWAALEARVESRVSAILGRRYELDRARRVLLFDGIRSSGTSPKVDARDLHGQAWRIKWGDEVQTEPLGNRLYVALGGKFADLVYASEGGARDLVLVLQAPDPDAERPCDNIATVDRLLDCLRASKYKFDLSPYIVGRGVISEEALRREPFASAPGGGTKLLGREHVWFNASSVEFQTGADTFLRLEAAPMSSGGALDDRVKRGLAVLTYWLHNKDAKDDNNKGVVEIETATYTEYMHDLGASLGSLIISGNPNRLKIADAFLRRRRDKARFEENMLYLPKAFDAASHADAVWMARKIAALSREELDAAVASTAWPDFQQQVMATRLIARRNAIAEMFGVGAPLAYDLAPTTVPLGTAAERRDAVRRYRLPIATQDDEAAALTLLEDHMRRSGIAVGDEPSGYRDQVTVLKLERSKGGEVLRTNACERSVVVSLLERVLHPAGLSRRVNRRSDDEPMKPCQPSPRTLGLAERGRRPAIAALESSP